MSELVKPRQRAFRSDIGRARNWPARFWAHVVKLGPNDCWEWTGARHPKGYGTVRWAGKTRKAHRVSYQLETGVEPPANMVIMHICDNPPCVNPAHLRLGTYSDNAVDMFEKGRATRPVGIAHHQAKLTDDLVRKIRADSRSQRAIALSLGVSQPLVGMVKRGEIWQHVTD